MFGKLICSDSNTIIKMSAWSSLQDLLTCYYSLIISWSASLAYCQLCIWSSLKLKYREFHFSWLEIPLPHRNKAPHILWEVWQSSRSGCINSGGDICRDVEYCRILQISGRISAPRARESSHSPQNIRGFGPVRFKRYCFFFCCLLLLPRKWKIHDDHNYTCWPFAFSCNCAFDFLS